MTETNTRELIIEDKSGRALRTIRWHGEKFFIVERGDNRRMELVQKLDDFEQKKIQYKVVGEVTDDAELAEGVVLPRDCRLRLVTDPVEVLTDPETSDENDRRFLIVWSAFLIFSFIALYGLRFVPPPTRAIQEDLEKRIVRIVKKPEVVERRVSVQDASIKTPTNQPRKALKRMGALAALGSLQKSAQRGGLNLGAAQTSRGIGLGGTEGSGGTQTSIYTKGLVAAPLGTGGNIKGAGGYGTKGKGGGQAGYGQLSLVGSAGTEAVPLGREAIIEGGLDRDLIAEVVRRNQGQIMFCYEQGLQSDPKLAGRVAVKWTIGGNGQVKAAQIENSTLNAKIVEDCILARLKSWKFPLPQGGVDVSVSYPFMLKRAGQG